VGFWSIIGAMRFIVRRSGLDTRLGAGDTLGRKEAESQFRNASCAQSGKIRATPSAWRPPLSARDTHSLLKDITTRLICWGTYLANWIALWRQRPRSPGFRNSLGAFKIWWFIKHANLTCIQQFPAR
jgi:hypothetical protein